MYQTGIKMIKCVVDCIKSVQVLGNQKLLKSKTSVQILKICNCEVFYICKKTILYESSAKNDKVSRKYQVKLMRSSSCDY